MNIYAIHDLKAEAYLKPFFAEADGLAIRMFQEAANDPEHGFHKYAEDYTLFAIGVWDERAGVVHASTQKPLGTAIQYRDLVANERELEQQAQSPAATMWTSDQEKPPRLNSKSV